MKTVKKRAPKTDVIKARMISWYKQYPITYADVMYGINNTKSQLSKFLETDKEKLKNEILEVLTQKLIEDKVDGAINKLFEDAKKQIASIVQREKYLETQKKANAKYLADKKKRDMEMALIKNELTEQQKKALRTYFGVYNL